MRVALTALTAQGPRDIVVNGGENTTVGEVAASVQTALGDRPAPTAPPTPTAPPASAAQPAPEERLAPVIDLQRRGNGRPGGNGSDGANGANANGNETQPLWLDGRQVDPRAPAVRALRDGAFVTTDPRGAAATATAAAPGAEPSGVAEIRVAGGTVAGHVHRVGLGTLTLGGAPDCDIRVPGYGMPPLAARLIVTTGGVEIEVPPGLASDAPPPMLDGAPVQGRRAWPPGLPLKIGPNVLVNHRPEPPDAHLSPAGDGGLAYNRPPRLWPSQRARRIEVPAEPKRGQRVRLQFLAALIPLALGLLMVKLMHQWMFALFMIMSPVMIVGQWLSDRRAGRSSYKKAVKEYHRKWDELDSVVLTECAAEEAELRFAAPDPAQILLTATGPRTRLWERRADDDDLLRLRIGLGDRPSSIEFVLEKDAEYGAELPDVPGIRDVPVTLPLPELGVIGLSGVREPSRGLARWLVAQAAALHSPRDLSIVVLVADPRAGAAWNWVRWLPHCAPRLGEECVALVGADPESAARRVAELAAIAQERIRSLNPMGTTTRGAEEEQHKILVVLDGARALRRIPGMPQVLANHQLTGIYAICVDDTDRELPEECTAVVSWDAQYPGWVRMRGAGLDLAGLALADQVSVSWADRVARALAPIRDVSRDDSDAMIPAAARLLDVLAMPDPAPEHITELWRRLGRTTAVPIGVGADGTFTVDLRADGPHALVAGTTGAGKSELLQTLIASLAVANRPDAMTFVLIDYKGGSAFKDCARLPHTVGMVSDLDGHLTERALASLSAELKRREEILLHAGAKDIEDYWDVQRTDSRLAPLPRLVLIIDEFASLVAELPEFVTGLVGIAQRGRSLGVHLILATQRPAGVVSADIRANTNLRIALRVTDTNESIDVIDVGDAARIAKSTPGRCYVRSGASAPVAVQSARIGGRRPGASSAMTDTTVTAVPWQALGRPLSRDAAAAAAAMLDDGTMATDLSVLVDAIAAAANRLGIAEQRSPWLPPLPETVTLDAVPRAPERGASDVAPVPFGITDIPARQAREPLTVDLAHGGHLVIAGAPRSGRSTALRTIAGSVAAGCSPADVHIYGLDCGTGALLPLAQLPHCGAVVSRDQNDRVERLLGSLRAEITRRQQVLAAQGFAGVAEQRAACADPRQRLPWMLLLFDWWEGYAAAYEGYDFGRLIDAMLLILREGPAVGLRAVVTTDRAALMGQVGTVFQRRLVLNLADRDDVTYAGLNIRSMPAHQPPGRLMFLGGNQMLEAQVALLAEDPAGVAQVAALHALAARAREAYPRPGPEQRALRVDALPMRTTIAETLALNPDFKAPSPLWALVGAGGDELGPQGIDLGAEGPGVVLAGPPRSGRSTALTTMARSLLRSGTPVLAIAPRRSPLRSLAGSPGVLGVLGADVDAAAVNAAIDGLTEYVIVIDDAELLSDSLVAPRLDEILVSARDAEHAMIVAGATSDLGRIYSGFVRTALKSRCGVFVGLEGPSDGDLFGIRLPRGAGTGAGPLGRGLIVRPGSIAPVQIALPE
ncbi:MAG TPA: FtsK/SpoIIIE domain-containing protein [Streptosporangiaceae bacterium]|nr:FtsK/SpoIIIE domain-containing protein [Streptosporangiaceae bacterium]